MIAFHKHNGAKNNQPRKRNQRPLCFVSVKPGQRLHTDVCPVASLEKGMTAVVLSVNDMADPSEAFRSAGLHERQSQIQMAKFDSM